MDFNPLSFDLKFNGPLTNGGGSSVFQPMSNINTGTSGENGTGGSYLGFDGSNVNKNFNVVSSFSNFTGSNDVLSSNQSNSRSNESSQDQFSGRVPHFGNDVSFLGEDALHSTSNISHFTGRSSHFNDVANIDGADITHTGSMHGQKSINLSHNQYERILFQENDYSFHIFKFSWHFNQMNNWFLYGKYVEDGVAIKPDDETRDWRKWESFESLNNKMNKWKRNVQHDQDTLESTTGKIVVENIKILNTFSYISNPEIEKVDGSHHLERRTLRDPNQGVSHPSQNDSNQHLKSQDTQQSDSLVDLQAKSLIQYSHFAQICGSNFSDGAPSSIDNCFINWSDKNMIAFCSIGRETIFQDVKSVEGKEGGKMEERIISQSKQVLFLVDPNDPKHHSVFITPHTLPIKGIYFNSTVSGGGDILTFDENSVVVWNTPHSTACINDLDCQLVVPMSNVLCAAWINRAYVYTDTVIQDNVRDLHAKYEKREKYVEGVPHGRSAWISVTRNGIVHLHYRTFLAPLNSKIQIDATRWAYSEIHLNSWFQKVTIETTCDGMILIAGVPPHSSIIYTYILSIIPKGESTYALMLRKTIPPISVHSGSPNISPNLNNHFLSLQFVPYAKVYKLLTTSMKDDSFYLQLFSYENDARMHLSAAFHASKSIVQSRWKLQLEIKLRLRPSCIQFSKDGLCVCVGYVDGSFEIRDLQNLKIFYENFSLQRFEKASNEISKKRKLNSDTFEKIYLPFPIFGATFSPSKTLISVIDFECRVHVFVLPLSQPTDLPSIVERSFLNYYDSWDILYILKCWIVEGKSKLIRECLNRFYVSKTQQAIGGTYYGQVYERFMSIAYRLLGGEDNSKSIQLQSDILLPIFLRVSNWIKQNTQTNTLYKWISMYMYLWTVYWGIVFLNQWYEFFESNQSSTSFQTNEKMQYLILDRHVVKYLEIMNSHKANAIDLLSQNTFLIEKDSNLKILQQVTELNHLSEFLQQYVNILEKEEKSMLSSNQSIVEMMRYNSDFRENVTTYMKRTSSLMEIIQLRVPSILAMHLDLVPQLRGRISVKDELSILKSLQRDIIKDYFTKEMLSKDAYKYCKICSRATFPSIDGIANTISIVFQKACPACGSHYLLS